MGVPLEKVDVLSGNKETPSSLIPSTRTDWLAVRLALVPIIVGLTICLGWQFRIGLLRGDAFSTFVAPNSALLFALLGIACELQLVGSKWNHWAGQALAVLCFLLSAAFVTEYLVHRDLGIDTIFMRHRLSDWTTGAPAGRPSFPASAAFVFASVGMAVARLPRWGKVSDTCATFVSAISYLALVGYLYRVTTFYGGVMALHTAVLLGVLALVLFTARRTTGVAELALSAEAGGVIFRRVILAIVVLTPLLGFLVLRARQAGFVTRETAIALLVVTTVFLFTALTARTAYALNVLDRKRKQTEMLLMRTEKLAAAGRLAATIAHEINNPLAAVTNLVYLARRTSSTEQSRHLELAEYELHRVAEIARRTLGFYRDEARPTRKSLAEVAEEVLHIFEHRIKASGIRVATNLESRTELDLRAGEIRQIMMNLVGNALDALADCERPQLELTIRENTPWIDVLISDNGTGISPENRRHLFEPFFTTKEKVGTGLGLYVSRQLAISNAGALDLLPASESLLGGCTFRLRLRSVQSPEVEADTARPARLAND